MAKDFKPAAPRHSGGSGKPGMHPMLAGILIGLLLGITLALGVAIWLNRANSPFVEKAKPVEALPTIPAKPANAKPDTPATAAGANEKPRFEFYQILPGEKDATAKKAPEPPAKPAVEARKDNAKDGKDHPPAKGPEEQKEAIRDSVYLQAGAFQNVTDAENLKAKIAFAGMEALVKPVNLANKGTLYRVRLGPYTSLEEANRIKASLSQSGIPTAVIKGE
ncbi:MAG: SPOR domain-containing protein [Betaproteobacteria bacterium]|nr:SPOR domain-containing protein [Betaproteobacteria bacterium]